MSDKEKIAFEAHEQIMEAIKTKVLKEYLEIQISNEIYDRINKFEFDKSARFIIDHFVLKFSENILKGVDKFLKCKDFFEDKSGVSSILGLNVNYEDPYQKQNVGLINFLGNGLSCPKIKFDEIFSHFDIYSGSVFEGRAINFEGNLEPYEYDFNVNIDFINFLEREISDKIKKLVLKHTENKLTLQNYEVLNILFE